LEVKQVWLQGKSSLCLFPLFVVVGYQSAKRIYTTYLTKLSSDLLISNPTLDANPSRYSSFDGEANINAFVAQFRYFLSWSKIDGQFLNIRGHLPHASEVVAQFYDHESTSRTLMPIQAQAAYQFAPPTLTPGPSADIALKEITARFDSRTFSQLLLSRQFDQVAFQKRALKHAICARLESGLINGNPEASPAEFAGLFRLVEMGLGQRITADDGDQLNILDEAMTRIRAHNRRCNMIVMNQNAWRRVLNLQRSRGFRPQFRWSRILQQPQLMLNGVPVCLTDHIPTQSATGAEQTTSIFFLALGRPNGVFGIVSRKRPRIFFTRTSRQDEPFQSYQAHLYSGLASATSDALVELANWNVTLRAG
jgi:hypothetical protein